MWKLYKRKRGDKNTMYSEPKISVLKHGYISLNRAFIDKYGVTKDTLVNIFVDKQRELIGFTLWNPERNLLEHARKLSFCKTSAKLTAKNLFKELGIIADRLWMFDPVIESATPSTKVPVFVFSYAEMTRTLVLKMAA